MKITFPGITQEDFEYAFECLEDCRQESAVQYGFCYPFFSPGGAYGAQWWQLDSSVALGGYRWQDRAFAEKSLWNFIESQKENGRICLWGADKIPPVVAGGDGLGQTLGISSLPKLFDITYHILKESADDKLRKAAYNMLKKYIDWWFEERFDKDTGLITAVFEETFIPYLGNMGEYAPPDTNVEVYVGCHYTGLLAEQFGKTSDAEDLKIRKNNLKRSINTYLWDDEKGAYYPYNIKEEKRIGCLMASTFFPLRLSIAEEYQKKKLVELLKNHKHFNWDTIPLTSVSKEDEIFTTTKGGYQGNASWSGNVWTLINEMVVRVLKDCGETGMAAELALKTVRAFNHNCAEFLNPFDGTGHGVEKYAWTASQYVQLIVETIFGISYNEAEKEVVIVPRLTAELKKTGLALEKINVTANVFMDVVIENGKVKYTLSDDRIKVRVIEL